jgi:hypothetical protein
VQNTGKRCVILLVFIILRWSFNYESNVFQYNKILIDCVFGNNKFVVLETLTIDLGFASDNSQRLENNKLAIPSYPVNKYIILTILWSSHLRQSTFSKRLKIIRRRVWRYQMSNQKPVNRKRTDNAMAKRKRTNNDLQITTQITKDRTRQASRKYLGWTRVLHKGKQFLLHMWHSSCYS